MQVQRVQNNNTTFGMKYPITRTKNIGDDFVQKVEKCLDSLPDKWQETLQRNNYELFCSESIQDTFNHLSIREPAPEWDAVTSAHPVFKFFVFTPKINDKDMQRVINHEISHGIVNSEELAGRLDYLQAIHTDAAIFPIKEPNFNNPYDLKNLSIKPIDGYRINEVFADMIAWFQKGGGLWGSGYKGSKKNPNFLQENYPLTYTKIKHFLNPEEPIEQVGFYNRKPEEIHWGNDEDLPF